jgi:hypothetical protein
LYGGNERIRKEHVLCVPTAEFLRRLCPGIDFEQGL